MEVSTFFIFWIAIIVFFTLLSRIRQVPPGTVVIIDRNSHFHKKKRSGFYLFNPAIDKITTKVSRYTITETYTNTFATHDSNYYRLTYAFSYKAEDVDMVLSSLEDSRRSIYDVVNCAVETAIGSLTMREMADINYDLNKVCFTQLESMLEPFYVDVLSFKILYRSAVHPSLGESQLFKKHVSRGDNPVGSLGSKDDDPIVY